MDDQTNLITLAVVHAVKSGLENVDLSLDEAIQMTFEYLKSINYWSGMPQMMQQSHKSAAKATELRTRGNLAFQDGRSEAFKHYSESVAVAPAGSQELAFAYGNRSTAAFRIGQQKHIECLVDINRAFQENYPEAGKQKLIDRKEKCVEFYQRTIKTYKSKPGNFRFLPQIRDLNSLVEKFSPEMTDLPAQFPLPKVHFKNKLIPNASDKIKIGNTGDNEIGIVATADIEPGEIIAIEKPVAWSVCATNPRRYCAHCFGKTDALLPCLNCSVVMFCSTHCRDNAFGLFHRIECEILCQLAPDVGRSMLDSGWTIVRLLLVVTKQGEELDKIMNDPAYKLPFPETIVHNVEKVFNAQDLSTVLAHGRATDGRNSVDVGSILESHMFQAAFLWLYFLKHSTYFGDQITGNQNFDGPLTNRELYVVTLLLKLSETTFRPVREGLRGILGFEKNATSQFCGQGLFPFINIFKHSCDPHVYLYSYGGNLVCRSIRPIKAGEEIFICYYRPYHRCPKSKRIKNLLELNKFECTCEACEEDWPTEDSLPVKSSKIVSNEIGTKEFHKYRTRFKKLQDLTLEDLATNENLEFLCKYSSILNKRFEKPCRDIIECERLLDMSFSLCGNFYVV